MAQTAVAELEDLALLRKPPRHFLLQALIRLVREKPLGLIGGIIVVMFLLMAALTPIVAPGDPNGLGKLSDKLMGPSLSYPLGTDNLARDVMTRVIHGARVSVTIGFIAVAVTTTISMTIGVLSSYFGGWIDLIFQRLVDSFIAFPPLVFLIVVGQVFGGRDIPGLPSSGVLSTPMIVLMVSLGVLGGVSQSRVIRGAGLSVKSMTFIEAARTIGASDWRIIFVHIVPNVVAPVITLATIGLGGIILTEATLSFLGLGAPPDVPTWGGMINREARTYMSQGYWWLMFPGIALSLVVFGFNVLGDALRDILDPRLRGGR